MENYKILPIKYDDTKPFILNIHYAKRLPSISYSFGLFNNNELVGIITYGTPASNSLCKGIAGDENKKIVLELNRLVLKNNIKNEASFLVGNSLKLLKKPKIIVSYADTKQNHNGYVYQATNFLFTGTTKPRTDMAGKDGKHSRHHLGDSSNRVNRSAKHRYVYILGNKKDKKNLLKKINYPILEYPKFKNKIYKTNTNIQIQGILI
tara:strand:- start:50 stop:670 length:621 start_codon:yes stop_codon:yes gene_type:complete